MKWKFAILLCFVCANSALCGAQGTPNIVKQYYHNRGFPFGIEHLTLGSDNIFFFSISAESGAYLSKGTWDIKRNKLYLKSFDSTETYPRFKIDFIKGGNTPYVTILAKDYFNKPFQELAVRPISRDDSSFYKNSPIFADSLGQIKISKEEYWSFYFLYQFDNSDAYLIDSTMQNYIIDNDATQINIYIDFAASGRLDRGIKFMTLGSNVYKLKKDGLYHKRQKVFDTWKVKH